jgi:protein-disulfide isomerase
VTEYGDLQCPVCKDFAQSGEQQLISKDVRQGKVRLIYKSLATATLNGPNPGVFPTQQAAAYAAGLQNLGWYYILNFYRLQGQEDTNYVNTGYLNGIARLVPGLNFAKWSSDRTSSKLTQQVTAEQNTAKTLGLNSTPTLIVQGPKGQAQPVAGDIPYNSLEQLIQSVS